MTTPPPQTGGVTPPVAPQVPHRFSLHGVTIEDPYAWLKAANWQEVMRRPELLDERIRAYLEAENAYTAAVMADTEALQQTLFAEMKARIKEDDSTVPAPYGAWAYYSSYVTGGEYPLFCRQPRDGGPQTVLLDGNAMAAGLAYFDLQGASPSPDQTLLAYGVDDKGSEYYTLRIRDMRIGADLADVVESTSGHYAWALDNRTLYYTHVDQNHRRLKVFRHRIGTPASTDELVFEEKDEGFFTSVGTSQDHRYIVISTHDHQTSEVWLIDAADAAGRPSLIEARETEHQYSIEHRNGRLIILTNSGDAEDFRIVETPVATPGRANWREIVPHKQGRLILSMEVLAGHLIRLEREDGLPRIVVRDFATGEEHAIAFEEEAYSLALHTGYEFDTTAVRFTYSSMTRPAETYDYDVVTRERQLRKVQEVPSGHEPSRYVTRRIMALARDGEAIPISLLYLKETPLDGSAPLLLYGYGAYGISMPAGFSTNRLSLVDRGFVYAIAHVRGGKEKGYRWYREGRREKKINTFHDFIAAAEHLIRENYTARGRIVAHGGSAGGMLMGAVANMAPDLFLGIIAEVPFVDVLATMLDDQLPLTPPEWNEWGNPIADPEAFRRIHSYSPYDNVAAHAYPAILAMGGLTDPRVTYWEPAKWVARLRALKTDDNLLLLKINMDAGHGGASGRFERLKETALAYAFALKLAGLN